MSKSFLMHGNTAKRVHGAHSYSALDIRGHFMMSGPQGIGKGGCPQWVSDAMDANPDIKQIAINGENSGVVFTRMAEAIAEAEGGL